MRAKAIRKKSPASGSRRRFLKELGGGAALAAAATGISTVGCQMQAAKVNWSAAFDWISIGSGLAGCAAAIFGHDKGFKTLLLEKSDKIGGLTTQSGGSLWTPMNPWMKAAGIEDSREDAIAY